jgi:predicted N-acetyltransferase YhbS
MKTSSPGPRLPIRRGPVEFCLGSEADHEAVYQTLLNVFHGPDRETFLGALSDPSYQPEQRLLAKVDGRIASHLHLTSRPVRVGGLTVPLNGIMWVATLPEYRGLGLAHNLIRLATQRANEAGVLLQTLTTSMPAFYRPLGWGVCGNQTFGLASSRILPSVGDGLVETKGGPWHVRPWRQVELGDLMRLYDGQFGHTTGTIARSEEYWRWIIGRRYAHVIWVACQGEAVHGYAFVKDHKILEIAADPAHPQALKALLGRVRAEALERAYPEVVVHAPVDHPALTALREAGGRVVDQEEYEGSSTMYTAPDPGGLLRALLPDLQKRARDAKLALPVELGLAIGDRRWLLHIEARSTRLEPDKLSRRYVSLDPGAFVRLALGHCGIDRALSDGQAEVSASTAIDTARVLFPSRPIWRSPLDSSTA